MKTRQQNIPSEYEESEEAERLDGESSDDSEYASASEENTSEDNDQANEDSPSSSRGTGATDKISTSVIPRPSNALSDNPIQVVFHLNPPKHALSEVFSPQQLSQLGLQSLAQWMAQLISESDTPGSSQSPATEKGKRPLSGRGVQTRGGHSKRTKVSRDSAADLSSLPFSQSHDTRSLRTQTSSHISPTPITTPTGQTMVSSAPQPTPQMTSPIGKVGPALSTIVHQTGLSAATTISMEPSTSTPTPRTSAPQGITHFMSPADKLFQMERSATLSIADAINTIHGAQKMHAVTYESMYEELLDTHQRVYDRDVKKAALFDRNRILNRQVKDLKEVISSLNLQLREAQEQLQQNSVVTTMVCERCVQMELTVTTPTPVATISLPTQGIPTTYSGGVSLASHTLTGSHEQTEVVTSMPLPPHGVFTCPLPGRPYVGASTYAPSMPATPFVSSSAPIQPHPNIYSSHFGTLPQYNMQLPTPHHLPSPSQALVSSSVSLQPNPALYSSHFGTLPGYHMAIPPPSHLPSPSQVQPAYSIYPNLGFGPYNPLPYNYPPAPYPSFYAPPPTQSSSLFTHHTRLHHCLRSLNSLFTMSKTNILYIPYISFCFLHINSPGRKAGAENYIRCSYILPDGLHYKRGIVKNPDVVPLAYRHLPLLKSTNTPKSQDDIPMAKEEKSSVANTQELTVTNERFLVPEMLFHPADLGMNQAGIAECIVRAVNACHRDLHPLLYSSVVLTGGTTKLPGFKERLELELRPMVPAEYNLNIHAVDDPIVAPWRGGSLFASSEEFESCSITRGEYEELGSLRCRRRFIRC
ncbi:hypothetical protein L7F22_065986 [Adiantum nelumboides]|nr:hypothetical protein [Adiantum nelumboides]